MKNKTVITSLGIMAASILMGAGIFATVTVTDNAGRMGIRIGIADIETVDVVFKNADGLTDYYSESVNTGGKLLNPPSNPTKSGYVFDGWTTDNSSYEETTDNFDTKTYTANTVYYPRFASYGYTVGSGDAQPLTNAQGSSTNLTLAKNASLKVGTYIFGKAALESVAKENSSIKTVTIPHAGDYSLVCGAKNSTWSASNSVAFSNWHIEKYYTLDITNNWSSYSDRIFAHYYYDDVAEHKVTTKLNQVSGNKYYSYAPYYMENVVYLALWENTSETSGPNSTWSNVKYKLPGIALSETSSYEMIDRTFTINYGTSDGKGVFLVGNFHGDFEISEAYRLSWTNGNDWTGTFSFIKDTSAEFKFVIADYSSGANAQWESDPNRSETFSSTGSTRYYWR